MQRVSYNSNQPNTANPSMPIHLTKSRMSKIALTLLTAGALSLTGCQTIKKITGNEKDVVATANKPYAQYYKDAMQYLDEGKYAYAAEQLSELRIFYPTGAYAESALLHLMYAQFQNKQYTLAAGSAEQFIKLYPNNPQIDYAYYVRGVANMQSGSNALLNFAKLSPAHRDTAYLRLAFSNFQELISRYPNSSYTPDAAQRMIHIYNQFAEGEMAAARWYIKRKAYVAAANRANWVFQYYPLSQQTPEAIATLAFSNEQLGLSDLAQKYKTLLQINYPEWLTHDGQVKLEGNGNKASNLLHTLTFGKLGRADQAEASVTSSSTYTGQTKTQIIGQATQLKLPSDDTAATQANLPDLAPKSRLSGLHIGLGLPKEDRDQLTTQTSTTQASQETVIKSPKAMYPDSQQTQLEDSTLQQNEPDEATSEE